MEFVYWGLDVNNIKDINDVKSILSAMDLFIQEDLPEYNNVKHLFTEKRVVSEMELKEYSGETDSSEQGE
jgi:ArsR family metal-binding transcriptional regulator